MGNKGGIKNEGLGRKGATGKAVHPATPESRIADDREEVDRFLRGVAASPAAARLRLHHRQRLLREKHAHLDRSDPHIARAIALAAKHRREHDRDHRRQSHS